MKIFPAIDLYDKKAVRLLKGDYNQMTVYSDTPAETAADFERQGAGYVHIVDLEGARSGTTPNIDVVADIVKRTNLFVEVGGGVRSMETIHTYIGAGVSRVILGTAAVEDRALLRKAIEKYGSKIAVGADVRNGYIAVKGWLEQSGITLDDFLTDMEHEGIQTVICTDISRDGAMRGTNLKLYSRLSEKYHLNLTASGGISTLEDIRVLAGMQLYGAIIGKACYTGAIRLKEAIEVAG